MTLLKYFQNANRGLSIKEICIDHHKDMSEELQSLLNNGDLVLTTAHLTSGLAEELYWLAGKQDDPYAFLNEME